MIGERGGETLHAVAVQLRQAGVVETEVHPADRRRLIVRRTPEVSERAALVAATTIDAAVAAAMGFEEGDRVRAVVAALESLARELTPDALAGRYRR